MVLSLICVVYEQMFLVEPEVVIYTIVDGVCRALAYVHLLKKEPEFHF